MWSCTGCANLKRREAHEPVLSCTHFHSNEGKRSRQGHSCDRKSPCPHVLAAWARMTDTHHCVTHALVVSPAGRWQRGVCLHTDEREVRRGPDQCTQPTSCEPCSRLLPERESLHGQHASDLHASSFRLSLHGWWGSRMGTGAAMTLSYGKHYC